MKINQNDRSEVIIDLDNITLRFGDMEPVVILRAKLRTRLQLIDWVYRLTGWPGMSVQALRAFIAGVFHHHGWDLSDVEDNVRDETSPVAKSTPRLAFAA